MSTTPPNTQPPNDPNKMGTILSALVNGDASLLISLYHLAPAAAVSVLETLLAGDHQSLSRLMNQLFITKPVDAFSIFQSFAGSKLQAM